MKFEELQPSKCYFAKTHGEYYAFKLREQESIMIHQDHTVGLTADECFCLCDMGLIRQSYMRYKGDADFYEIDENVIAQLRHIYNNSCISAKAIMDRTKESIKH